MEGDNNPQRLGPLVVRQGWQSLTFTLFIDGLFLTEPSVIDHQAQTVEETIGDIVPGHTMPEAHDQHIDYIGYTGSRIAVFKDLVAHEHHNQAHKDKVSEPERQAHVPAIPEFLQIA